MMQSIRTIGAIWKRELGAYFSTPIAYVVLTVFLTLTGAIFFFGFALLGIEGFFETGHASLRSLFRSVPLVYIILVPGICMRLFSEEKRSGTIELLVTMPVRDFEIIAGKFLAAWSFLAVTLLVTAVYPILVAVHGDPDIGPMIGGYLGLLLIGACYISVGMMTSSWTRNQIISFILSFLICAFFYFINQLVERFWESARGFFDYISFEHHFLNIAKGVLDSRDIVFYLSIIVICITVAHISLARRRWQ